MRCVFKHSSHFSSMDVTPFILRGWRIVCAACGTVWSRFEGVGVLQVALWWVCVGIVWLLVKEIKRLLVQNDSFFMQVYCQIFSLH